MEIKLKLNGKTIAAHVDADTVLLDFLREHPEYLHRIVLETDNPHNGNIGEHYRTMADLLGIKAESLQQLMAEQFERLFNGRII